MHFPIIFPLSKCTALLSAVLVPKVSRIPWFLCVSSLPEAGGEIVMLFDVVCIIHVIYCILYNIM